MKRGFSNRRIIEKNGHGHREINYKLRDWLFSRQRYWGEPFPIVWESEPDGQHGKHRALDESELPVEPPELGVKTRSWLESPACAGKFELTVNRWLSPGAMFAAAGDTESTEPNCCVVACHWTGPVNVPSRRKMIPVHVPAAGSWTSTSP